MTLGPNTADDNEREKQRASDGCNIRHALSHRRTGNRCSAWARLLSSIEFVVGYKLASKAAREPPIDPCVRTVGQGGISGPSKHKRFDIQ